MTAAPISVKETLRLAKLRDYGILDTLPDSVYDDITALAASICQTPTALVSLVDINRQWFKSRIGLDTSETPRSVAFCAYTIEQTEPMVVKDTHKDSRFKDNPLVTGPPFIRFYAGAPLVTPEGHALGSLCVIDYEPHYLEKSQLRALQVLSHQVMAQMELSLQRQALEASNRQLEARVKERTASLSTSLHRLLKAQMALLKREAASRHNALHDPLTNLPNRSYFLQRLNQAIQLTHRQPSHHYAVLFIDIDDFKGVNDSLGHGVGDRLLVHVAEKITQLLRQSDLVARLGGDEFAVLLDDIPDNEQAIIAVKRLQEHLAIPVEIDEHQLSVAASIGLTFSTVGYRQAEAALKDADTAMYQAKMQTKRRIQKQLELQLKQQSQQDLPPIVMQGELPLNHQQFAIFDATMQGRVQAKLTLEEELRQAFLDNQFQLHYQPIFDLNRQRLSGFEMLLRWYHPTKGHLSAQQFIEMAEDIGIVQQLCAQMIRRACEQVAKWRSHPDWSHITLHMNLSLMQIRYPQLAMQWQIALEQYGLPASAFQLEIAEQALLSADPTITAVLKRLRLMGFELCIDDFGRGHSSLSRLHQLAVGTLKVDRTFVQELSSAQGKEVVKTIVDFAHSANMAVIAEGVETSEQMTELLSLGCHQAQGFWLADALPATDIDQLLSST
ncbi:MAG: EAL domain-containing protein [Cyanobacteria bacterium J06588_5]